MSYKVEIFDQKTNDFIVIDPCKKHLDDAERIGEVLSLSRKRKVRVMYGKKIISEFRLGKKIISTEASQSDLF